MARAIAADESSCGQWPLPADASDASIIRVVGDIPGLLVGWLSGHFLFFLDPRSLCPFPSLVVPLASCWRLRLFSVIIRLLSSCLLTSGCRLA